MARDTTSKASGAGPVTGPFERAGRRGAQGAPGARPTRSAKGGKAAAGGVSRDLYRVGDVAQILGVSRRQLQYWSQTDLVRPGARTPGGHARYAFEDLVALKTAKRLIDAGVSVQRIRKSIRALRQMLPAVAHPLAEVVLVATGDVVLAFKDGTAFDAISGQEWVFEVAQLEREIEDWRVSARRSAAPRAGGRSASSHRTAAPPRAPDRNA